MRLLVDTHILLWMLAGDAAMPQRARELVTDEANEIFVSAIAIWEIAIKYARNRGRVNDMPVSGGKALALVRRAGMPLLSIEADHAAALDALPPLHADPFDRLFVAQAGVEGMKLLTHDKPLAAYGDVVMAV